MKNSIVDVRNMLMQTMQNLVDPEDGKDIDLPRAKVIAELGKVLIDSAKAEALYIKAAGKAGVNLKGTGFIGSIEKTQLSDGND